MAKRCPYRLAIARLIVRTYVHALIVRDKTKRTGMARECPVGDLVSSFAYANRGIRTGHVALHIRSGGGGREGESSLPHGSALLSSRVGYCRRNTSEQSTILLEIRRVFVSARMNKCQSLRAFSCRFLPVTPINFLIYIINYCSVFFKWIHVFFTCARFSLASQRSINTLMKI